MGVILQHKNDPQLVRYESTKRSNDEPYHVETITPDYPQGKFVTVSVLILVLYMNGAFHLKTNIVLDRPSRISTKLFLNIFRLFLRTCSTRFFVSKFIHY
jgi:hypothetical protein